VKKIFIKKVFEKNVHNKIINLYSNSNQYIQGYLNHHTHSGKRYPKKTPLYHKSELSYFAFTQFGFVVYNLLQIIGLDNWFKQLNFL